MGSSCECRLHDSACLRNWKFRFSRRINTLCTSFPFVSLFLIMRKSLTSQVLNSASRNKTISSIISKTIPSVSPVATQKSNTVFGLNHAAISSSSLPPIRTNNSNSAMSLAPEERVNRNG